MSNGLSLRRAQADDCRRYFEWANDPAVRLASFSQSEIPWHVHEQWFADRLRSPSVFYVVELVSGPPIGHVRFDPRGDGAMEVGIVIGAEYRGQGWSAPALALACRSLRVLMPTVRVIARVRPDNTASLAAFRRAGFVATGSERVANSDAVRLELPESWH